MGFPDDNKIVQQFNKKLHPVTRLLGLKLCLQLDAQRKTCQHMKQKLLLIILFACTSGMAVFAQSVRISGVVTTSAKAPLPGANIAVKGSSQGVISNDDGQFSITAPANATLIISHIGFSTRMVSLKGQTTIMVSLDSAYTVDIIQPKPCSIGACQVCCAASSASRRCRC